MTAPRVRVLDLTDDAAVYATRLLADLGAEVVRVEPPASPQPDTTFWDYMNAGKRSVALDLRRREAREVLARLCAAADVVVDGLAPAVDQTDAAYARLCALNPRLCWVAVRECAPGSKPGSLKTREIVRYACSGLMSITGQPDDAPMLAGGGLPNAIVATYAALAATLAVRAARAHGCGHLVWVSAHEALLSVMQQGLLEAALTGRAVRRAGGRHAHIAMAGALPCRDGHVVISANERRMWRLLVEMVGDKRLADETLDDEQERLRRQSEIFEIVAGWSQRFGKHELADAAQARGIPAAPVHDMRDVLHDPHLLGRGFFQQMGRDEIAVLRTPWAQPNASAPRPGQHTEEVLREAGLTLEQIRDLETAGVAAVAGSRV